MRCASCGKMLPSQVHFCAYCRTPILPPPRIPTSALARSSPLAEVTRTALGGAVLGALGGALIGGFGGRGLNLGSLQPFALCGALWGAMGGAVEAQRAALSAPQHVRLGGALASILVGALVGAIAGAVFAFTLPVKPLACFGLFGRMSDLTLLGILTGAIVVALTGAFPWEVVSSSSGPLARRRAYLQKVAERLGRVVSSSPGAPSRLWNGLRGATWGGVVGLLTSVTVGAIWQAAVIASDTGSMGLAIQEAIQGAGWGVVRGPIMGLVSGAIVGAVKA